MVLRIIAWLPFDAMRPPEYQLFDWTADQGVNAPHRLTDNILEGVDPSVGGRGLMWYSADSLSVDQRGSITYRFVAYCRGKPSLRMLH